MVNAKNKPGADKGRIAYYGMVGLVSCASVLASGIFGKDLRSEIRPNALLLLLALAGIGIYLLSWYLSVVFYKKREL